MSDEQIGDDVSEYRPRMGSGYRWGQTAELSARGGHNWVVRRAFDFIRKNCPDRLPKGLEETYVHYGLFFADNPWAGRPRSVTNPRYPCGSRVPSVREDLWAYEYHKDTGPTGEVHVRYQNKNDPNHPNLALMCTYEGEFLGAIRLGCGWWSGLIRNNGLADA